jgi:hypothetical protein
VNPLSHPAILMTVSNEGSIFEILIRTCVYRKLHPY